MSQKLEFTLAIKVALNYEQYHHPIPLVRQRMEVLWLKSQGFLHAQIAQLAGVPESILLDYIQLYEVGGLDKLKEVNRYPDSELGEHIVTLEAYFQAHPPATISEAQHKIEVLTGVRRGESQVCEFLKRNSVCVAEWVA